MSKTFFTEAETSSYDQTKNSIYFVEGESFFSRCMLDYFITRGWGSQFAFVEADPNIDDVSLAYPNMHLGRYEQVFFSDSKFDDDEPNLIIEIALEDKKTVAVNITSYSRWQFDKWLKDVRILSSDVRDLFNSFIYFFVTDGSYQSIEQFLKQLKKYPMDKLFQCLVLNPNRLSCTDNFGYLEKYEPLIEAIKIHQIPVLILPKLDSALQFECDQKSLSYRELNVERDISIQQKVTRFSNQITLFFDEIFPSEINAPQGLTKIAEDQKDYSNLKKVFRCF